MKMQVLVRPILMLISVFGISVGFQNCSPLSAVENSQLSGPVNLSVQDLPSLNGAEIEDPGYDIIVIAGQSNAVGIGQGFTTNDSQDRSFDSKIFQVDRPDHYPGNREPVIPIQIVQANDHLHFWGTDPSNDFNYGSTFDKWQGFGMPFARLYAKNSLKPGRKVLIVPAACGGTSIGQWLGLTTDVAANYLFAARNLYPDMKTRIQLALSQPGHNKIVAFLWHQGETDISLSMVSTLSPPMPHENMNGADTYHQRFVTLMTNIRQDFPSSPAYPILAGEWVPHWAPDAGTVTAKQNFINLFMRMNSDPDSVLVPFAFVRSTGLLSNFQVNSATNDDIHFSASAQVELGMRYFNAFQNMPHP